MEIRYKKKEKKETVNDLRYSTMFSNILAYVSFVRRYRYVERLHKKSQLITSKEIRY